MKLWKMIFLFNWLIFRFYVDFRGVKLVDEETTRIFKGTTVHTRKHLKFEELRNPAIVYYGYGDRMVQ